MNNYLMKNSGMILILAMLIIAAVLAAAAIFANLIIKEIQLSRLIDQSIQAYYVAESGAERALYQTRKREAVKPDECGQIIKDSKCQETYGYCCKNPNCQAALDGEVSCITEEQGSLAGLISNWEVAVTNERNFEFFLEPGQFFQLDFFNPYQDIDPISPAYNPPNIESIGIDWGDAEHEVSLYYTLLELNADLQSQVVAKDFLYKYDSDSPSFPYYQINLSQPVGNKFYIFRLQGERIEEQGGKVVIYVYNGNDREGDQLDIPNRLIIESSASYGDSWQKITVRTPRQPSLAGLYDFVLFAEERIIK